MRLSGPRGWLRGWLAALFVAVLATTPMLDALLCADGSVAAAAFEAPDIHGADADLGTDEADHGACPHGHCHHGGAVTPAAAAAHTPYDARNGHDRPTATGATADRQFGLMRPPRA